MSLVDMRHWSPSADPHLDFHGVGDGRVVVLVDEDVFDTGEAPAHFAAARGPSAMPCWTIVPTRHPSRMREQWPAEPSHLIPALIQERMDDYDGDAIRDFCLTPAQHHALVVRPRELLHLGLIGIMPKVWAPGYRPFWNFLDLVIVAGPLGPQGEAWPMDPAWVREVRDEALHCAPYVDFILAGWGSYVPKSELALSGSRGWRTLDGAEHRDISWL